MKYCNVCFSKLDDDGWCDECGEFRSLDDESDDQDISEEPSYCNICGEELDDDGWCSECLEFRKEHESEDVLEELDQSTNDSNDYVDIDNDYEFRFNNAIKRLELSYEIDQLIDSVKFKFNRLLENMKLDKMPTKFIQNKRVYYILKNLNEKLQKKLINFIDEDGKFKELPDDFDEINDLLFYIKKFFKTEEIDVVGNLIYYAKDYLSTQDKVYLNGYLSEEGNLYAVEKQVKYYAFGEFDDYKKFEKDLPNINDIYDFDNFIKWLVIGVELKHYELMRVQMLIFMNGYGSITKDYIKAEKILRELLKLGDYSESTNRYKMSYYSKYLAEILINRNEIALAIGEIYSTSLYPKYTFEEVLPEYVLICEIIKNACFIYHGSWTDREQDISFDRKKFNREIHVYNKLVSLLESKEEKNIKFLQDYLEYLKRKQEYNKPEYVSMSYDDYYDPNPTEQELFEWNQMHDLKYKDVLEKINDIYESNWKRYNNFKYEIVGNEIIIRKYVGDLLEESIPESIDGILVTALDEYVFHESKIEHIDLPGTIAKIGMHCFAKSNLKVVNIPSEVKILEKYTFENCKNLSEVVLGKSIEIIEEKCFSECGNLTSINIPKNVLKLEWASFEECVSLKNLSFEVESNLKIIESEAFRCCEGLEKINLPGSLFKLGSYSFANCTNLHIVSFETSTKNYSEKKCLSCGNILDKNDFCEDCHIKQDYNLDEYTNIEIDSNLNHLYLMTGAFYDCEKLSSFSYSNDLIKIYDSVFRNTALREFTIKRSIKYIDGNPFLDCRNLIITCEEGVTRYGFKERFMTDNILVWKDIIKNNDAVNIEKSPFLDKNDDEIKEFYYYDGVIIAPVNSKKMVSLPYGISSNLDVKAVLFPENCQLEEIEEGAFSFSYKSSLKMVGLPKDAPIQNIPKNLFSDKEHLISVTLSNNVIEIGEGAFKNCKKLEKITLPDSIKRIGEDAFYRCESLKDILIPSKIENVGESAFGHCEKLEKVCFSKNSQLKMIPRMCFYECELLHEVDLPNSIEIIGPESFAKCTELTKLEFPSKLKEIGRYAFHNCSNMTVNFNDNLEIIRERAFQGCSMNTLDLNPNLKIIETEAFCFCPNLKKVILPKSIEHIGESVFMYSDSIEQFDIHDENENYCSRDGVLYDKSCTKLIKYPSMKISENYVMPSTVLTLGSYSMQKCINLKKVSLSSNLKKIESYSLDTKNLDSLTIPFSVEVVERGGVYGDNNTDLFCEANEPMSGWDEEWSYKMKSINWNTKK